MIDDYSRAVAGSYLDFEPPSSLRTAFALRQGIWRKGDPHWEICGIPDTLYTDNGADFTSMHIALAPWILSSARVLYTKTATWPWAH